MRLFWQRQGWLIVDVAEAQPSACAAPVILDPGETEVLALAQALVEPLVLLDDEVARAEARRLRLQVCGTLGILVRAYHERLLSLDQVELLIREIAARPDIWISARLCPQVLAFLRERPPRSCGGHLRAGSSLRGHQRLHIFPSVVPLDRHPRQLPPVPCASIALLLTIRRWPAHRRTVPTERREDRPLADGHLDAVLVAKAPLQRRGVTRRQAHSAAHSAALRDCALPRASQKCGHRRVPFQRIGADGRQAGQLLDAPASLAPQAVALGPHARPVVLRLACPATEGSAGTGNWMEAGRETRSGPPGRASPATPARALPEVEQSRDLISAIPPPAHHERFQQVLAKRLASGVQERRGGRRAQPLVALDTVPRT